MTTVKNCLLKLLLPTAGFACAVSLAMAHDIDKWPTHPVGAVYTMDNAAAGNNVWAFPRLRDGQLGTPSVVPTGGTGSGSGLGSQGAVILSEDGQWLFVCDSGSDEISVFWAAPGGLILTDKVSSGGQFPISLTLHDHLLYVLNAGGEVGGTDSLAGFAFFHGHLFALPKAVTGLSTSNTAPAEVAFTSDGRKLVVTEKGTGLIDTFTLNADGMVDGAKTYTSPAPPPFGFASGSDNRIYVTEAAGGAGNPSASSVSSYRVGENGALHVISASVPTHQTAACWMVLSTNERFGYCANTPNNSLSSFLITHDGRLELLNEQAGLAPEPADMGVSRDDRFLYATCGNGTIAAYWMNPLTGSLTPLAGANGLPTTIDGMAVR